MVDDRVTIVIPTFNRQKQLINTLKILQRQSNKEFDILLLDNCSNYNVQSIVDQINVNQHINIQVERHDANIGMCTNLAMAFLKCKTKWCWLVPDDDVVDVDAIEKIYKAIKKYPMCGFLEFPVMDYSSYIHGEQVFRSIKEYIYHFQNIYKNGYYAPGNMIYCGNRVFNMDILKSYIEEIFEYSYSAVPHLVLAMMSLSAKNEAIVIPSSIINFNKGEGTKWNVEKICSGLLIIRNLPLNVDKKIMDSLMTLVMPPFAFVLKCVYTNTGKTTCYSPYKLYKNVYYSIMNYRQRIKYGIISGLCTYDWGFRITRAIYIKKNM